MTDPESISVLMPAYNAARYVAEAVESILSQTYPHFEFLIVDDGSTDRTRKILERYAKRDPRIRLVSRPNTGYVVALNEMLGKARGEFLARMDADDVARPERFERQIAYLREHPDVVCVGGQVRDVDSLGHDLESDYRQPEADEQIQEGLLRGRTTIYHPTAMMRREVVHLVGGYRVEMWPSEDLDLWLRLGEQGRLANLEDVVLLYRVHFESTTTRHQDQGFRSAELASNQACERRGLAPSFQAGPRYRPTNDRTTRLRYSVGYGWMGFRRGERRMALHYALQAIRWMPFRMDGWRLLACAALKPIKKGT